MSVIDTLVYDRTQADVDRVKLLKEKILLQGLSSLTPEEQSEYMGGMKGAYNYTDLNRVGEAVNYIKSNMVGLPDQLDQYREEQGVSDDPYYQVDYDISGLSAVSGKTDWTVSDIPSSAQMDQYLNNISRLMVVLPLPPDTPLLPTHMQYLGWYNANVIEQILKVINDTFETYKATMYGRIDNTVKAWEYCNLAFCGE